MIEALKELTVVMCALMLIISVVEALVPRNNFAPIIRWVVLLFTLISIIKPIREIDTSAMVEGFSLPEVEAVTVEDNILNGALDLLSDNIRISLESKGISVGGIEIELSQGEHGVDIGTIYIEDVQPDLRETVIETVGILTDGAGEVVFE